MRLHDDPSGSVAAIVNGKDRVAARGIGNSIASPDPVYPRVDPSLLLSIVFESLELFEPRDFQTTSRYRLSPPSPLTPWTLSPSDRSIKRSINELSSRFDRRDVPSRIVANVNCPVNDRQRLFVQRIDKNVNRKTGSRAESI